MAQLDRYAEFATQVSEADLEPMDGGLISLTVLVTEQCNLRCSYCYIPKEKHFMSEQVAEATVDFLFAHAKPAPEELNITFFGGEPLVFPERIEQICEYANHKAATSGRKINYSMTTNGTLMDAARYALVKRYNIGVQLSLDGVGEVNDRCRKTETGKGSFELIERNLQRLLDLNCGIRLTVSPDTAANLADSVEWILRQGFRRIAISPVIEGEWTAESLRALTDSWWQLHALNERYKTDQRPNPISNLKGFREKLEEGGVRRSGCGAARGMVAVNSRGALFPCHRYVGYFRGAEEVAIGHVQQGFDRLRRAYYIDQNRTHNKPGCGGGLFASGQAGAGSSCARCALVQTCGSACMAVNHHMTGEPNRPAPINRILSQIEVGAYYACNASGESQQKGLCVG